MKNAPSIVWFFHDLRLSDNIALTQASERGAVIPLYIYDDSMTRAAQGALPHTGSGSSASRWWLDESLKSLSRDLKKAGAALILRRGPALSVLRDLIAQTGAKTVFWARRFEPELAAQDAQIAKALRQDGVEVIVTPGFLLFEPEAIRTQAGGFFKVYTPFSKACFAAPSPRPPLPAPSALTSLNGLESDDLANWKLTPRTATWPRRLAQAWEPGERAAAIRLKDFIDNALAAYKTHRDRPDIAGTSRLSPYLHFGQISPRQVWHAVSQARAHNPAAASSAERYLLELLWREFSGHLLTHIPDFASQPLQKSFVKFPWANDPAALTAWQKGKTGYPIVDAGMRELEETGWMHNRVRMIVASFLIKDLLIDWRYGMAWFEETLVDADLGSNAASWQWVAGCGADAAPYFRIFNPVLQGQKFDPNGTYIRRFVPELASLDTKFIHEPWKAPTQSLVQAGITLGKTYPAPIVDHAHARQRALEALKETKASD